MKRPRSSPRQKLNLVRLEDRSVPATFIATTFLDLDTTGFDPTTGKLPTGEITLRSAILAANATAGADTVVAPAGTYFLTIVGAEDDTGTTGDLDVTDVTTLQLDGVVIDASGIDDRVFDIPSASAVVSVIHGTFQNGKHAPTGADGFGGGIRNLGTLTLNSSVIANNRAIALAGPINQFSSNSGFGGGIASQGNLTIIGGEIRGNQAVGSNGNNNGSPGGEGVGGGLYQSNGGTVQITGTRISTNGAFGGTAFGFGEFNQAGRATGGGVATDSFSTSTITGVRIDGNRAIGGDGTLGAQGGEAYGGGLAASGSIDVQNTTIDSNFTQGGIGIGDSVSGGAGGDSFGGGASLTPFGNTNVRNSTISGNKSIGGDGTSSAGNATRGGGFAGGLYLQTTSSSGAFVASTTITDNEAFAGNGDSVIVADGGGAVGTGFSGGPTTNFQSTIIAGNRAATNPDVSNTDFFGTPAPFVSLGSNLIGASDGGQGFTDGVNSDQVGSISTPIDPLLTPLGFLGGDALALVHAPNIGSPARDKGDAGGLSTDQRGTGFDRTISGTADVGAFEVQIPAVTTQSVMGTVIAGQSFTITGTVTDPRFPPTGSVEFFVNGNSIGTAALDSSGNATIGATVTTAGPFTVSIVYGGDAAYLGAVSTASVFVAVSPTTSVVSAAPDPSIVTQAITFTSVVSAGAAGTPTGTVQFIVDGSNFGAPVALDGTGSATLVAPGGLTVGVHTIASVYSGDASFGPSNGGPVSFTLNPSPSTTLLSVAPNPVFATDPISLLASVSGPVSLTPTGTVEFFFDGVSVGVTTLDGNGQALLTLPAGLQIGDGNFDATAVYSGAVNFLGSTSALTVLSVIPVPTATTLVVDPVTAAEGTAVTLTASVAFNIPQIPAQRAGVDPAILDGTVTFLNGATQLGVVPLDANGLATLVVTNLPLGTNAISAVFTPATANLAPSTGTASVTITARTAIREVFAASSGYGIVTTVKVYDPNGVELGQFQPYGSGYWCGAVTATGDVNGDGVEDIIVAPSLSGGPHVKVFDGTTFNLLMEFFAYDPSFRGGVSVGAGDLDGDGVAEIVTGAGPGGGPQVNIYSVSANGVQLINSFFAYEPDLRSGITVAVSGGLIATGPGFTGGPHVKIFNGMNASLVSSYFAFDPNSRDGVHVALSFDGTRIVLTAGTDAGRAPIVQAFDAVSGTLLDSQIIFEPGYLGGVTVTNVRTLQGESRTVYGTSLGGGPRVRIFGPGDVSLFDFFAFAEDFRGGVFVG